MAVARPGAGTVAAGDSRHRDSQPRGTGRPDLAGAWRAPARSLRSAALYTRSPPGQGSPVGEVGRRKVSDPPMQGALDFTGPTAITVRHFAGQIPQESFRRGYSANDSNGIQAK